MHYIDIHTHKSKNKNNIIEIISIDTKDIDLIHVGGELCSIGIHPWFLNKNTLHSEIEKLEKFESQKEVIAIGECGLDRYSLQNENDLALQLKGFNLQAQLAERTNKPMILHAVNSYSDFLHWLKEGKYKVKLIFHGFNGNEDIANKILKYDCWLSFGESILNSEKVRNVFKNIPLECCFLETDESNISIEEIYTEAANLRNIEIEKLKHQLIINFKKVFGDDRKLEGKN